jgi:hypothetical protein
MAVASTRDCTESWPAFGAQWRLQAQARPLVADPAKIAAQAFLPGDHGTKTFLLDAVDTWALGSGRRT